MAKSFKTVVSLDDAGSAASESLRTKVSGDTQSRLSIDAGGKLTWGSGSATGDVNLYRDAADALKTDDTLEAAAGLITSTSAGAPTATIADGALAVDTTNDAFYFRSGAAWQQVTGGGGSITTSDTAPVSPDAGDLWYETDTGRTLVYYADGTSSQWVEVGASASVTSRLVLQDDDADTKVQVEEGTDDDTIRFDTLGVERMVIKSDGKVGIGTTTPATTLDVAGDLSVEGVTVTDATNAFLTLNDSGGTVGTNTSSRVTFQAGGGTAGQIGYLGTGSGIMSIRNYDGPMYIQTDSVDPIIFKTTATEQVRITDAGKVGIGTTAPINEFHVAVDGAWGGASSSLHSIITSNDGDNGIGIYSGNTKNGYLRFGDTDSQSSGGFNYDHNDNSLKIRTNGTDHINISSAGKVGIGTTAPTVRLDVAGEGGTAYAARITAGAGTAHMIQVKAGSPSPGTNFIQFVDSTSTEHGNIKGWGAGVQYLSASDRRLKTEIVDIPLGLEKVLSLKPRSFKWIASPELGTQAGFIADEVAAVMPSLVHGDEGALLTVEATEDEPAFEGIVPQQLDTIGLVPLLVSAIQDQQTQIDALTARIETLETA